MNDLNYIFFEEFKRLDKLCGELYDAPYGVTHYIDDMKSASQNNCRRIPDWNTDLKELIRLRHIRNHLAHTEGAFYETVCTQTDIDFIKNFHQRILNQSDPLAALYQMSHREKQILEAAHNSHVLNSQTHNAKDTRPDDEEQEPHIAYLLLASAGIAAAILFMLFAFFI